MELAIIEIPSDILEGLLHTRAIDKESFTVIESYDKGYKDSPEYIKLAVEFKNLKADFYKERNRIFTEMDKLK